MMDLISLFLELVATIMTSVTKPFSLVKLSCIFGVRSFCIIILTLVELLRAAVNFHVNIFWRLMVWTCALISLPVRVLTALQRERLLAINLHEVQIELENLVWNRKELEEHLQIAIKERRMLEVMLADLEDEHDEAIMKIELLETELQHKKEENMRLKEVQGKALWSFRGYNDTGKGNDHGDDLADKYGISCGIQSWKPSVSESNVIHPDLKHKDAREVESKTTTELPDFVTTELKGGEPIHAVTPVIISTNLDMSEVLGQRREVALQQSLFSAVLSLLVGTIVQEAGDPCMPLVVALFTVVGMSLKSVVLFFSTIKNKPACDAVALLSFNCFMLGTLTYPTLPIISRMLTPTALSILELTVSWLGILPKVA